jgi:hypothetical protein
VEGIPFKMHARGWNILSSASMANNLLNVSAELITNSIDSYDRLLKKEMIKTSHKKEVCIKYKPGEEKGKGIYIIIDQAEGMTSKDLEEKITEYGKETSGEAERGLFGFGLKDVCLTMDDAKIISIVNNKISEYIIEKHDGNPYLKPLKKDETITAEDREKTEIKHNGTCVILTVPQKFNRPSFISFFKQLQSFYPLRKIFQDENAVIFLLDEERGGSPFRVQYEESRGKVLLKKNINFNYKGLDFTLVVSIKQSEEELEAFSSFRWSVRKNGLLVYYGKYSVIDYALFGYDFDTYARSIFGEVKIEGKFKEILKKEPDIIDTRRKGFNKESEFYQKIEPLLSRELKVVVDNIIKEARKSGEAFNPKNMKDALKEINKIAKNIVESKIITPPVGIITDYLTFYYRGLKKVEIKEAEEQGIFLLVNTKNIPEGSKIKISCNNNDIIVNPTVIKVSKEDVKTEQKNYIINLIGKKADVVAKLVAITLKDKKAEIDVIVNQNPSLHPKDGFQFVPNEKKLTVNETEIASLIIEEKLVKNNNQVSISSSNKNIECLKKEINLSPIKKLSRISQFHDIFELKVSLLGKILDEKGKITANCDKKKCELSVKVVNLIEKATYGLFKGLQIKDLENIKEISFEKDGIITVNRSHPILKKYTTQVNFSKNTDYQTIVSNIFTQQICKSIIDKKREEQKLQFLDIQNPESMLNTIEIAYTDLYFEHGYKFNEIILFLFKKEWS